MFRKSLTTLATVTMLSAPLASYAQSMPTPAPAAQQQPHAAAARGRGLEGLVVVGVIVVIAGFLAHRR